MNQNLLAARLGLTNESSKASAPIAQPVAAPGRPQGKTAAEGNPTTHLSTALAHAKAGKHHEAKKHALKAVNLLHRMAAPAAPAGPPAPPAAPPAAP